MADRPSSRQRTLRLEYQFDRLLAEKLAQAYELLVPEQARPTPEALGVDVFATMSRLGYPLQVLRDYDQPMDRYAFLLIE